MNAYVTRDSVSAADDIHAPHARRFSIKSDWTWQSLVDHALHGSGLPEIAGGKAVWALSSNIPLAVVAQQWDEPVLIWRMESDRIALDQSGDEIRLHWSYFAQLDPELVLEVLRQLRLQAAEESGAAEPRDSA